MCVAAIQLFFELIQSHILCTSVHIENLVLPILLMAATTNMLLTWIRYDNSQYFLHNVPSPKITAFISNASI